MQVNVGHPYPGGQWETTAHCNAQLNMMGKHEPGKPVGATECGYHTGPFANQPGVTEVQQRDRTIAGLLEMFACGWQRVYLYELADLWSGYSQDNRWGLYRNDWTPKPVATALGRWMAWMRNTGTPPANAPSFGLKVT